MTEEKKTKSGAGKFFLGAALGAIAGAIASKFISVKDDEECDECECKEDCECKKPETEETPVKTEKKAEKKIEKKAEEKPRKAEK